MQTELCPGGDSFKRPEASGMMPFDVTLGPNDGDTTGIDVTYTELGELALSGPYFRTSLVARF